MKFDQTIARLAAFAVLVVVPDLSACAADSSGAHVFARQDNGTNIVSRLVPDGTDVATTGMISGFAQYYPDGSVKSSAEFTPGIKYNFDTTNHTATVKPFCDTDTADNDNSSLIGRVVIPPYVDEHGNPYVADDGTRFKVTALSGDDAQSENTNLTAIVAPTSVVDIGYGGAFDSCAALVSVTFPSVTNVGYRAFYSCTALVSVKIPNATDIGVDSFAHCYKLASVSLPAATSVGNYAFISCGALTSVSLPAATSVGNFSFNYCRGLTSVDFGDTPRSSVPTLGTDAFRNVQTPCKIIVPDAQYNAWITTSGWSDLVTHGYKFLKHSEWDYAHRYEIDQLLFKQYYPEGNVKSVDEFTLGIKYDAPDTTNRTITVKPFCNTGTATNDNSNLSGRVVIPPFVDVSHNGYITDDGTRFRVVGVGSGSDSNNSNENLTAVIAPSTVTNIEDKAFHRCTKLTSVSAQAATSIGSGAFNTCSSLVSVSLPAAASIVSWAFVNCASLKSISLSAATSIGDNAFRNCASLKSVSLPAATSIKGNAFNSCYLLVSVSLPVAVNIKGSAFNGCYSLASVSLPAATSIDGYAFTGCTSLESIDFGATLSSVPTLGSNVFNNVPTTCKIIVPDAQYDAWIEASGWSDLVTRGYKFLRHSDWEYIRRYEIVPLLFAQYYPDGSVKSAAEFTAGIRYNFDATNRTASVKPFCDTDTADNDNSSLVGRVVIPPFVDTQGNPYISDDGTRFKVTALSGDDAQSENTNLTAIVAPTSVADIGYGGAFDDCAALVSVTFPAVTNVGYRAFYSCTALVSVKIPNATDIGAESFSHCTSLASVSLPAVTAIGEYAFYDCTSLTSVSLSAATIIGVGAFSSCTSLDSVSLPVATTVDANAFESCSSLVSVSLPAATAVQRGAFSHCTSLSSVSIPAATAIWWSAFYNCTSLTSVSLPAVTTIMEGAFYDCTSLTSVDFGVTSRQSVPSLGENVFNNVSTNCTIIVPDAQYNAWTAANLWKDLVTAGYKFLKHSEWEYARKVDVSTLAYNKADVTRAGAPQFGTNDFWTCWDGTVLRCDTDRTGDFGGYSQAVWVGTNTASSIWRYQYPTETMLKYSCEKATGDYEWTCDVKYSSGTYAGEYVTYAVDVGGVTQYVYPDLLSESPSGEMATNIDFGVSYPEDGVELHLPIIRKADATVVYSDQLAGVAKVAGRAVRTPDYNNTNNFFYAISSDATSALAGFADVGTHTWPTTSSGIGYLRMVGPQTSGPMVSVYVNEVGNSHRLFTWDSTYRDIVVPVFLNAGDSLILNVDGSKSLSFVQFSMFYTD